jgi:hypothetical protein
VYGRILPEKSAFTQSREIPRRLWNPAEYYGVNKRPLKHSTPLHSHNLFLQDPSDIILKYVPRLPKRTLQSEFYRLTFLSKRLVLVHNTRNHSFSGIYASSGILNN